MSDEQDKTLVERLEWLVNIEVGTTWTEYHWREALQICQDVFALTMGAAQENKTAEDLIASGSSGKHYRFRVKGR